MQIAMPDISSLASGAPSHSSNEDIGVARSLKSVPQSTSQTGDANDLRQFLQVVRPDWSCPLRGGHNNIYRVIEKLKDVGVLDTAELIRRVNENSINEELSAAGHSRFNRETLEKIRKESSFIRSLEPLLQKNPHYRQVGAFAPARQLCSTANLRHQSTTNLRHQKSAESGKKATTREDDKHLDSCGSPLHEGTEASGSSHSPPTHSKEARPAATAVGLGDHGGVFVSGTSYITTSDNFADLFAGMPNSKPGALYLRNARPRHGRSKASQARPITVCSLPDLTKLQRSHHSGGDNGRGVASRSYSPLRGHAESSIGSGSIAATWCDSSDDWASVGRLAKTSSQMSSKPEVAKWERHGGHVVRQGEAMLREQAALDDRKSLFMVIESEGSDSPMRRHLTSRIKNRLREEKKRDEQGIIDAQQQCMSIRNNLGKMQAARRDLIEQKRKAEEIMLPKEVQPVSGEGQLAIAEMFRSARNSMHPKSWSQSSN